MSQYKVPQDVEADDKLLGPFTFRQLIYLFVTAGLIAIAYLLATISLILVIIPVPLILLFGALALPLKKDQPMETYLAAVVSYYLKPRKRFWNPGQRESTIEITAPKLAEESRIRNISGDEASHRLSFLANIVDTEGSAIRDTSTIREELIAEANATPDIFDAYQTPHLDQIIARDTTARHDAAINQMKAAIEEKEHSSEAFKKDQLPRLEPLKKENPVVVTPKKPVSEELPEMSSNVVVKPLEKSEEKTPEPKKEAPKNPELENLSENTDFSIATIAKQADRIAKSHIDETNETFISLH